MSKEPFVKATVSETINQGIKYLVKEGEFASEAEYIRHVLREDLPKRIKNARIEKELLAGIASGPSQPLDWDAIDAEVNKRLKK